MADEKKKTEEKKETGEVEKKEATETTTTDSKPETVTTKLQSLSVEDDVIKKIISDMGASTVDDLSSLTEQDLIDVGIKKIPARKLITALTLTGPSVSDAAASTAASAYSTVSLDAVLPAVPSDASWLEALRAGGVLKVDQSTVISVVRAALAHRASFFSIPGKLVILMEQFADENQEQVDPEFYRLRKQMTRRSYAEIFEAIDGLDGSFVTEARRKELLKRIDQSLWPSIIEFHNQLKAWQEAWMQGAANPAMMMNAILAASGGGSAMPPGMMQPPDTGVIRDHADAVADAVNKVFGGTGVQIAAALAYDASKIKEALSNPRLPALIGAANRDQMLRRLEIAVSATYPRMEQNLTRFVLAIMQAKDQPAGNEELQYFGSLFMLGSQIPWDQLGGSSAMGKPTGIGNSHSRL